MSETIELLDVVALTEDVSELGVVRGQAGTVVEMPAPGMFEVEFSSSNDGRTYAMGAARADQLLVLHQQPLRS